MDQPAPIGIPRRRAVGKAGGRAVNKDFWFAPYDGVKLPSESEFIRTNKVPRDPNFKPSWMWALGKAATEGLWIVIPVPESGDGRRNDVNRARSSIFTTARRRGTPLVSEFVDPNLYVTVAREEE